MSDCLPFTCSICSYYEHEEIGDSDFGAVYAKERTCSKDKDLDMGTEEYVKDFDYESVKECCTPDFWLVADSDKEIEKLIACEEDMFSDSSEAYKCFKDKYKRKTNLVAVK